MRIDKTLSVGLVALLLMSMVMVGVNEVPVTKLCVDTYVPCWTWNRFVANVNVTDVEDLYSFEFKLAWNKTLLDLVGVNITSPEEWDTNYVIFKNETIQNYNGTHGRYWLNISALTPAPSFNGSTILVKLTFIEMYWPMFPEPGIWVRLGLYDTKLNDPEGLPILHEAHDGFYFIEPFCPCSPWLKVMPGYYEATTLGENFTINVEVAMFPSYKFTGWKAKLGYNTTLLGIVKVEEGPFFGRFAESDERYFSASINEEEGYVNLTGGILSEICSIPVGSGSLAEVTFNVTYEAQCSEDATCVLGLYDTNLTSDWESPIYYSVYDGFYQAPRAELTGDINYDGIVDIVDIVKCALAFGCRKGDPCYDPECDINNDDIVDIVDLVIIAIHYGCTC